MAQDVQTLKMMERVSTGIELGESHFREFKSAINQSGGAQRPRDAKQICRDIGEALVSFANADGGELYIGIEDDGTPSGLPHSESSIQVMMDAPRTHIHSGTPIPTPTTARINFKSKVILYFQVAKSTEQVHLTADGRCLQRFDKENRPVPVERIQYSRQEQISREYDRSFIDGATHTDLNLDMIDQISKHIAGGQSPEKFLQYLDLAEYSSDGLQLRRAALLLFAKDVSKWHPKCEVRIVRVSGTSLGVGGDYNVKPGDDHTVRGSILTVREKAWETLKTYLVRTKLVEGIFRESLTYPEDACREVLTNALAHRDYSIEGKGVEIFIYDDRLEIRSPGGLLSSISIDDLRGGKRTHQSRNVYIARVLRELGYMREMGEGMLRIFLTMRDLDLVPPELIADANKFEIVLHHRSVFSPKDQEWLEAYSSYNLSRDEQRAILLGRDGHFLSTNEIISVLGIVDTDQFRQLVERLRRKGILYNILHRSKTLSAMREAGSKRAVGRFAIRPPDQTEQYREELFNALRTLGPVTALSASYIGRIKRHLSSSSPYAEHPIDSLKLLGLVDEKMRPLPSLTNTIWQRNQGATAHQMPHTPSPTSIQAGKLTGRIATVKPNEGYGFIRADKGVGFYFHRSNLVDASEWNGIRVGTTVSFDESGKVYPGRAPAAKNVKRMS
jgi:ATP-dependent DNA helicase RecG